MIKRIMKRILYFSRLQGEPLLLKILNPLETLYIDGIDSHDQVHYVSIKM